MLNFQFLRNLVLNCTFPILLLLPLALCSSFNEEFANNPNFHKMQHKLNRQTTSYVAVHGVLLWASMGFLIPLGILTIRMSNNVQDNRRKTRFLFYLHAIFQVLAVLLATIGAVMSIRTLENSFNNSHQRLGLALYAAMWFQFLLGVFKPSRESQRRSKWYIVHWILGTTVSLVGIINIYTGLRAFQHKTFKNTTLWTILFTAQISCLAFFYLLQDKLQHIHRQTTLTSDSSPDLRNNIDVSLSGPIDRNHRKVLVPEACGKTNALANLFE